ncbi:gluconokinase [Rothia sp. CCM 9416]|uniref:gluconokinase n=1 Tax=Rothia sp. CCM 9416 TaxID=3402655 RepID=UPI003AE7777B
MKTHGAHHIVVMGVSGTGKTSVAHALRDELGWEFIEGDDLHPESNICKMSAGIPLNDSDRGPWLEKIASWIQEADKRKAKTLVTCSALKRAYRDVLREASPGLVFLHLTGDKDLIAERMKRRTGHFMPLSLLESQLATLEPLQEDEKGVVVDISGEMPQVLERAYAALGLSLT